MINIEFTDEEISHLEYERFHYPDPRVQRKMEVIFLKSQELPHKQIAKLCRISSVTLVEYLRQYKEGGIERLKLNLYKGKENELAHYSETLEQYFKENPPHTTKEAAAIIEEKTGVRRSLTQVREFLKRLGFKYRKTGTIPGKAATPEMKKRQKDFRTNELEPRLTEAEKGEREVFLWMPRTLSTEPSQVHYGAAKDCLFPHRQEEKDSMYSEP